MSREFVLVSCSKSKQEGVHCAAHLYEPSAIFRKRRAFAHQRNAPWGILSAKHGYLRPWEATPEYNVHIDARTAVWAAVVLEDLLADLCHYDVEQVTVLAGSKYVDPLVAPLESRGYDVVDWNRGKMPGQRMAALNDVLADERRRDGAGGAGEERGRPDERDGGEA